MAYKNILFEIKDKIAIITVNRPEALNALNWQTMQEIHAAFSSVKEGMEIGGSGSHNTNESRDF